jgi:membrane associated rhomboid family serine protease
MNFRPTSFSYLPEIVKNLLIINGLFFLATYVLGDTFEFDLVKHLGLHQIQSADFKPHQLITHMFLHGGTTHLLLNMFALWMFGNQLENVWGSKRFLIYFILTGFGAAILHVLATQIQIYFLEAKMSYDQINLVVNEGYRIYKDTSIEFSNSNMNSLNALYHTPTVGASGAVFGLLLAFGMLFPNTIIYLYFALPIKAKYFVTFYALAELYLGIQNSQGDNVAHFAHLGGMVFGYFLIKYWKKNSNFFY